jgi:hypothetical protein
MIGACLIGNPGPKEPPTPLFKHHRFLSIYQDSVLGMIIHSPGKHNTLQIAAAVYKIDHTVAMGYTDNILLNNRALVKVFRNVVTRGPNDLHAPFICLLIWIASHKSR